MQAFAVLTAGIPLMMSLLLALPAWCMSGSCDPVVEDRGCCPVAGGEQMAIGGAVDACWDCVEVDATVSTLTERPPIATTAIAILHRTSGLLVDSMMVDDAPRLPTGPPRASAILRDLRTVHLLI